MNLDSLQLVVFESELRRNFEPLSLTRPTFDFLLGARTLLERIERRLGHKATGLIVPRHLELLSKEQHPRCRINEHLEGDCLVVNSLLSPGYDIASEMRRLVSDYDTNFVVVDSTKKIVFAVLEEVDSREIADQRFPKKTRKVSSKSEREPLLEYPWKMVSKNELALKQDYDLLGATLTEWKIEDKGDLELLGGRNLVSKTAQIERFVTLDSRNGPIIVEDGASIQSFSHITGPCYIGKSSIVKSARLREGTSIGNQCRVGGEVEASIMHEYSNKNHDGFLGHSVVGSWVNLGALTTNSDLKNTYGTVKVLLKGREVITDSIKVGCFLSDMCKTSIGTLVFSGKTVGVGSNVFGIVSENVPSFTFYAKSLSARSTEIYPESSIETQRRMMERRKITMSEGYKRMMRSVFKMTSKDRVASHVKRGKFRL